MSSGIRRSSGLILFKGWIIGAGGMGTPIFATVFNLINP